jgi:hypothetical protein
MEPQQRQELGQAGAAAGPAGTGGDAVPGAAVGQQPGAPIAGAGAGQATEPTQPGAGAQPGQAGAPGEQTQVDLTEFRQFREWQAARDRREAELQRQLAENHERMRELEVQARQAEEARLLRDAEPDEVAAYYQGQAEKMRARMQALEGQQQQQAQIQQKARDALARLGLDVSAPGLDWSGGPTPDGLVTLLESAGALLAQRGAETAQAAQQEVTDVARAARQEAILETGAARVSTQGGAAPPANPIEDVKDPDTLLKMAMAGGGGLRD